MWSITPVPASFHSSIVTTRCGLLFLLDDAEADFKVSVDLHEVQATGDDESGVQDQLADRFE